MDNVKDETTPAWQAALAAFRAATRECRFPGCSTLTLKHYCAKHQPLGDWQISEEVRDEHKRELGRCRKRFHACAEGKNAG